ncbi:MAG: helix-turn-helix transcriptional regulator [Bacilli bacterium]|nr:helix-turn-helix transcriptional regulator [Bacilli bacterium]
MNLGNNIKTFRIKNKMTQEKLAELLGTTSKSVSRWEQSITYPDITLLPLIASIFEVTTDELLGYKLSEKEQVLADIKKEMDHLAEIGTDQEKLNFARASFAKFPNNISIKSYLASCLADEWINNREETIYNEAETLCLSIIDECSDVDIRYDAIFTLYYIYSNSGKPEKAKAICDLLSPMNYCRESVLALGIGDGNTELYKQDEIDKLTDALGIALSNYNFEGYPQNDPSTWNKKIEVLTISNQLYKMIYGDNLMYHHSRLSNNYWLISMYQIAQGKIDEALEALDAMCFHAIEKDKSYTNDHGKYFTSIITDKLIYPKSSKDFHELTEHGECYRVIEKLQHERYDCIRQNPRFIENINKLIQYAK